MKLFSKRYTHTDLRSFEERRIGIYFRSHATELISSEARNRLIAEIRFLSERDGFLEKFILFEDERKQKICLDGDKLDNFSLAELGYRVSDYFEFNEFKMIKLERSVKADTSDKRAGSYFDDYRLFDLAEMIILFSKEQQRNNIINRIDNILTEENTKYQIQEHLITKREGETLKSLTSILKNDVLRTKLRRYSAFEDAEDYIAAAKVSADIANIIFSDSLLKKSDHIQNIKTRISEKLLSNTSDFTPKKTEELVEILTLLLTCSQKLSNRIYDVRHTEADTIKTNNVNTYKLIAHHNMAIVELALTTLKDDYILSENWEAIKLDYIEKYKINPNSRLTIKKRRIDIFPDELDDTPINLEDIPF